MDEAELRKKVARLGAVLDRRAPRTALLDSYFEGRHPTPEAVKKARATKAFEILMRLSISNWPRLIVSSSNALLELQGVDFGDPEANKRVWDAAMLCGLDTEAPLANESALTVGRAFAIVWAVDSAPSITIEHASTTVVEYEPGSRLNRRAALRRWCDDGRWYATLYMRDALYKFEAKARSDNPPDADGWVRREVRGEDWPLKNPLGVVPVVELAINRTLRPSPYGRAWGEFEDSLGHIDRINYVTFAGLVAATWSGFPMRALIGDPILRDDEGNELPPFEVVNDRIVQIENPDGKLVQLPESTLMNYVNFGDARIRHLAAITRTPPNHLLGEMANLAADAIRAARSGQIAKIRGHHRSLGQGYSEVHRLVFRILNPRVKVVPSARMDWRDPEDRSLAERADAAVKLGTVIPWQALVQYTLDATPDQIQAWTAMRAAETLNGLLQQPTPTPLPAAADA
jgi:Phage portal protein, SPP1 Gp6-like